MVCIGLSVYQSVKDYLQLYGSYILLLQYCSLALVCLKMTKAVLFVQLTHALDDLNNLSTSLIPRLLVKNRCVFFDKRPRYKATNPLNFIWCTAVMNYESLAVFLSPQMTLRLRLTSRRNHNVWNQLHKVSQVLK